MELFAKIVKPEKNFWKPLTVFAKSSILEVSQGSDYGFLEIVNTIQPKCIFCCVILTVFWLCIFLLKLPFMELWVLQKYIIFNTFIFLSKKLYIYIYIYIYIIYIYMLYIYIYVIYIYM